MEWDIWLSISCLIRSGAFLSLTKVLVESKYFTFKGIGPPPKLKCAENVLTLRPPKIYMIYFFIGTDLEKFRLTAIGQQWTL